jgi:hypothetical protein
MADRSTLPRRSGDMQFWHLMLFGDGFEALASLR